jgi:NAD-dependent DNA ligase
MDYHSKQLENTIMTHRYLYYVLDEPVISDAAYDALERDGRARLPESSPVHQMGSSLAESYDPSIQELANQYRTHPNERN